MVHTNARNKLSRYTYICKKLFNLVLPIYVCSFVTFTLFLSTSCSSNEYQNIELIAHAGGEIDGHIYTNSLEPVQQSIKRGYKFIELDLALTSDQYTCSCSRLARIQ